MEVKDGTSLYKALDVFKREVNRIDKVLDIVDVILDSAYKEEDIKIKQELIENARIVLADGRKQLK